MLTCIARSKQGSEDSPSIDQSTEKLSPDDTKQAIKTLSSQIKDMALKASGAYRHCAPCANQTPGPHQRRNGSYGGEADLVAADNFRKLYRRTGSRAWGRRELEARLKGISSGDGTLASASGRRLESPVVFVEESEPKEWVAQVEPGVLITFVSLPRGGNDLKRIRFSREMFNKWQAQRWWAENSEKIIELYNVQRLNPQAFPHPTTPSSEDGTTTSKTESIGNSPVTPPLDREPLPRASKRPIGYLSSDSSDLQSTHSCGGVGSTPKLSSISGGKTETSSMDASASSTTTSSSREADRSGEISISNASDSDTEWVEQDEPGVYITIRALPDGKKEIKRVRFSREKFGELHARLWWEENRARIHKQYL